MHTKTEKDKEMSNETKDYVAIYGASDDLIEAVGAYDDEWGCYNAKKLVAVTVGRDIHRLTIEYCPDGYDGWKIASTDPAIEIVPMRGDNEPDDGDGCPGYSDKAIIHTGGQRVNVVVMRP